MAEAKMEFELRRLGKGDKEESEVSVFTELNAPKWLTSEDTVKGSTMDHRWFWRDHVLTLKVGEKAYTDFSAITRVK